MFPSLTVLADFSELTGFMNSPTCSDILWQSAPRNIQQFFEFGGQPSMKVRAIILLERSCNKEYPVPDICLALHSYVHVYSH